MKLAWLGNKRPDCQLEISQLAQVTDELFYNDGATLIRRLNRAARYVNDNSIALNTPKLNKRSMRIIGYSDASFANNHDLSMELGHICFLVHEEGIAVPMDLRSYEATSLRRYAMGGEGIAFRELFNRASTLDGEMRQLHHFRIPVQLITDSKSLFDVIRRGTRTSEKRMVLDIVPARDGFREHIISDIGFLRTSNNLAEGLAKAMRQSAPGEVISSSYIHM